MQVVRRTFGQTALKMCGLKHNLNRTGRNGPLDYLINSQLGYEPIAPCLMVIEFRLGYRSALLKCARADYGRPRNDLLQRPCTQEPNNSAREQARRHE